MDKYAKAKAELTEIDSQIAALQKRRVALQQFVALGASLYGDSAGAPDVAATVDRGVLLMDATPISGNPAQGVYTKDGVSSALATYLRSRLQEGSARQRILAACAEHIHQHGPTHTRDLLVALANAGVQVGGSEPANTVSVYLSRDDRFQSDRRLGWSLRSPSKEKNPQDAATSAGSDVEASQLSLPGGSGTSAG